MIEDSAIGYGLDPVQLRAMGRLEWSTLEGGSDQIMVRSYVLLILPAFFRRSDLGIAAGEGSDSRDGRTVVPRVKIRTF